MSELTRYVASHPGLLCCASSPSRFSWQYPFQRQYSRTVFITGRTSHYEIAIQIPGLCCFSFTLPGKRIVLKRPQSTHCLKTTPAVEDEWAFSGMLKTYAVRPGRLTTGLCECLVHYPRHSMAEQETNLRSS